MLIPSLQNVSSRDSHSELRIWHHFPRHNIPTVSLSIEPGLAMRYRLPLADWHWAQWRCAERSGHLSGGFLDLRQGGIYSEYQHCLSRKLTVHPYWYLKCSLASSPLVLSVCHGMLPWTMLTFDSEVADVGLRPGRWSIELAVQGLV